MPCCVVSVALTYCFTPPEKAPGRATRPYGSVYQIVAVPPPLRTVEVAKVTSRRQPLNGERGSSKATRNGARC